MKVKEVLLGLACNYLSDNVINSRSNSNSNSNSNNNNNNNSVMQSVSIAYYAIILSHD